MPAQGGAERQTEAERPPAPRPPGPPGRAPNEGRRTDHPPPSPAGLTHQRPARLCSSPGAAKQPRPSTRQVRMRGATPPAMRGDQGRGLEGTPP